MKPPQPEFVFTRERAEHIKHMMDLVRASIGAHPEKNQIAAERINDHTATIDDIIYHWMYLNVSADYLERGGFIKPTLRTLAKYFAEIEATQDHTV